MRRSKLALWLATLAICVGAAGCLTVNLPPLDASMPAADAFPIAAADVTEPVASDASTGQDVMPMLPAHDPLSAPPQTLSEGPADLQQPGPAPVASAPAPATASPPALASLPAPTVGSTPTATPTVVPTAVPSPVPTVRVSAAPSPSPTPVASWQPISPHPSKWRDLHRDVVKKAGGVDFATIAGGISCATCHTTHRAIDGTIPKSPAATLTCYSCHNGPQGE